MPRRPRAPPHTPDGARPTGAVGRFEQIQAGAPTGSPEPLDTAALSALDAEPELQDFDEEWYTEEAARRTVGFLRPVHFDRTIRVHDEIELRFYPAGHILGASFIEIRVGPGSGPRRTIVFGGDLGGGTLFGGVFRGRPMVEAFNRIPVDLASFGQHDFDFGAEHARSLVARSRFTWFTSKVNHSDT